jgi:hypothetical protein
MSKLISGKEALVYGFGVNDFNESISVKGKHIPEYKLWKAMLRRCYSEALISSRPTYSNCFADSELLSFDVFYNFVREQKGFGCIDSGGKSFHMDKDILGDGLRYGLDTISFVPQEINSFKTNIKSTSGEYPAGVLFHKASGKLISQITINGKKKYLGLFESAVDAFSVYKFEKEKQAKYLAEKYKGVIDAKVYTALLSYEVNIDD